MMPTNVRCGSRPWGRWSARGAAPWAAFGLAAALAAQGDGRPVPPAVPPDPAAVLAAVGEQFAKEGIRIDPAAQTVAIDVVVNQPQDSIEYLLVHRRGKRHEAVLYTKSKPSVLNAALLMIGLPQGKNFVFEEKQPPPTQAEVEQGVDPILVTPPRGEPFWMTVRWRTPEGQDVEWPVEDLLMDLSTQRPVANCSWVFLGGRMARIYKDEPEQFVADLEGNLVSICYLSPDNHLGTMVHQGARDDQNWWTTDKLPPPETPMELVFHRREPQVHKDRAGRLQQEEADQARARAALESLGWLVGTWAMKDRDIVIEEQWRPLQGVQMLGTSHTYDQRASHAFEFLRIVLQRGKVCYVAQPGGGTAIEFVMTKCADGLVEFENAAHVHPQRIRYERTEKGVTATVEQLDGSRQQSFPYERR